MRNLIVVSTIFLSVGNVHAVEVYNNDGTTFSIGGFVDVGVGRKGLTPERLTDGSWDRDSRHRADKFKVNTASPRLNITGTQELSNGWKIDTRAEWGMNFLNGGDNSFYTRLGYIGSTHEVYGRTVIGTQWSPYFDVAGVADKNIAFGQQFVYEDQGNLGTARADSMVSYRNAFDLSDSTKVSIGVGWQGESSEVYSDRAQAALQLSLYDLTVGLAHSRGKYNDNDYVNVDAKSNVISARYGTFGGGLYAAAVFAKNEYMNNDKSHSATKIPESNAAALIVSYAFNNSFNISSAYEKLEDKSLNDTVYNHANVQLEYNISSNLRSFIGYQHDLGGTGSYGKLDNQYFTGVRYFI